MLPSAAPTMQRRGDRRSDVSYPADFISVAEETGLINMIGDLVMRTACTEASKWSDDLTIAVNVSPVQFGSPPCLTSWALWRPQVWHLAGWS